MGRKKKSGNKVTGSDTYINLITAIINLVIAIILLYEKLTN